MDEGFGCKAGQTGDFSERMTGLEVSARWYVESNGPMKESVVAAWTSYRLEELPGIA